MPNIIAAAPDGCIAVIIGGRTDAIGAAYEGIGGADVGTTTEVEMGRCRPSVAHSTVVNAATMPRTKLAFQQVPGREGGKQAAFVRNFCLDEKRTGWVLAASASCQKRAWRVHWFPPGAQLGRSWPKRASSIADFVQPTAKTRHAVSERSPNQRFWPMLLKNSALKMWRDPDSAFP
jgi:hypothetical protein